MSDTQRRHLSDQTPSARVLLAASTDDNRSLVCTAPFSLSHASLLVTYPIAGWLGALSLVVAVGVLLTVGFVAASVGARTHAPLG